MKMNKLCANLHYLSAILFYLTAILRFRNEEDFSTGVIWLALGSLYLCLGSRYAKRAKEENEEET